MFTYVYRRYWGELLEVVSDGYFTVLWDIRLLYSYMLAGACRCAFVVKQLGGPRSCVISLGCAW